VTPPDPGLLETFAREHLTAYMIPKEFRFVAALPRTASMKVSRPELKVMLESDSSRASWAKQFRGTGQDDLLNHTRGHCRWDRHDHLEIVPSGSIASTARWSRSSASFGAGFEPIPTSA